MAIFIAANTALYAADYRLPIHNGCCATKPVIVFGEMWKGSLSSFNNLIFHYMPKTVKDYSGAKHSNATVTPTERNTVSIETFNIEKNANKNESGQASTGSKETSNLNEGNRLCNSLDYYSEMFVGCTIGKTTAKFLACIAILSDLSNSVCDAVKFAYGEDQADYILNRDYWDAKNAMETLFYDYVNQSIRENLFSSQII